MAYFISDGEGGLIPLEGGLPDGYGGPVYTARFDGAEYQDFSQVDPRIVNDPAIAYGEPGTLNYALAKEGRLQGGLSNPDAVAKFLNSVNPNYDWTPAIQKAYQDQVSQYGSGFVSGADDPAQTAIKIIQASGQPWAADAENYIRSTPDFNKSQAMGAQSQLYAEHQNDGTTFGIPNAVVGQAISLGLGPLVSGWIGSALEGTELAATLGEAGTKALTSGATGALSSAIMGGDPLQGGAMAALTPGLQAAGLSPEIAQALSTGTKFALSGGQLDPGGLFNAATGLIGNQSVQDWLKEAMGPSQDAGVDNSWSPSWTYDPSIQDQQDAEYGQAIQDLPYMIDGIDTRLFGSSPGYASSYQPSAAPSTAPANFSIGGGGWFGGALSGGYIDDNGNWVADEQYAPEPDYTVPDIAMPAEVSLGMGGWFGGGPQQGYYFDENGNLVREESYAPEPDAVAPEIAAPIQSDPYVDNSIAIGGSGWNAGGPPSGYYIDDNGNLVPSSDPDTDMTGFVTPDPAWLQPEQPTTPAVTDSGTAQPIQDNFVLPGYAVDLGNSTQQIPVGPEQTFNNAPDIIQQILNVNSQQDAQQNTQQDTQQTPSQETGNNMDIFGENNASFDPATQDWLNTYFDLGNATDGVFAEGNQGMAGALANPTLPDNLFTGGNANALGGLLGTALKTIFGTNADGSTKIPGVSTNANGSSNGMLPLLAVLAGGLLGSKQGTNTPAGNTTVTQDVPDWQKPYITGMLDNAGKVYKAAEDNNGFLSNGRNTLNSAISGDFLNANPSNAIYGAAAGYNNPYEGLLQPTATGAFLNANPYLDATYDKASRAMVDQYKYATMPNLSRQFGHMQAFGGNSGYDQSVGLAQKNLATGLGDLATGIYGGNYANERGMMQNAQTGLLGSSNATQGIRLSGAGGIGGNFNTARQQQLSAATTAPGYASETTNNAFAPINNYANLVGRSFGSQTQQPYFTNQSGGMLSGALGGLALANLFKG